MSRRQSKFKKGILFEKKISKKIRIFDVFKEYINENESININKKINKGYEIHLKPNNNN